MFLQSARRIMTMLESILSLFGASGDLIRLDHPNVTLPQTSRESLRS